MNANPIRTLTIVGGAGFLGRSLVERLAASPDTADLEVRSLDRVAFPAEAPRPAKFRDFVGNARDPELLAAALDGADAVWIRAAMLGGRASTEAERIEDYLEVNVELVADVLAAADAAGCRRVFFDSSEQVFGDSADLGAQTPFSEPSAGNYYGACKLIAEKLLRQWTDAAEPGLPRSVQIMRYSRVRAGHSKDVVRAWLTAAAAGDPIRVFGNSTRRLAFVHVDDLLAASMVVLRRSPAYALHHVGADRSVSLLELAQRVREVAHRATGKWSPIEFVEAPGVHFEPHVVGMEWEASRRELGLAPPIGLDSMLEETVAELVPAG